MNSGPADPTFAQPVPAAGILASITPFFIVRDLQASISHDVERFGFRLEFHGPSADV